MMMKRAVNVLRRKCGVGTQAADASFAAWTSCFRPAEQEMATMPTVTVYYQTVQDGEIAAMIATPTSDLMGKAYWVTLPAEAFAFPVTLAGQPGRCLHF